VNARSWTVVLRTVSLWGMHTRREKLEAGQNYVVRGAQFVFPAVINLWAITSRRLRWAKM